VFDIDISRIVTEYQAEILEDQDGKQYVAQFPEGVIKAAQYGSGTKAHSVYLSQYQLIPYRRLQEYFREQLQIPISEGSIFNFNLEASLQLGDLEKAVKYKLMKPESTSAANATGCIA